MHTQWYTHRFVQANKDENNITKNEQIEEYLSKRVDAWQTQLYTHVVASVQASNDKSASKNEQVEEYFFERVDAGRPVIIPGHGEHITGLGHVAVRCFTHTRVV